MTSETSPSTYDANPASGEYRLTRHQLEFDLTWRIIERFVPQGATILEIGCAAGAYTLPLVRRSHRIVAADLSSQLLKNVPGRIEDRDDVRTIIEEGRDPEHKGQVAFAATLRRRKRSHHGTRTPA